MEGFGGIPIIESEYVPEGMAFVIGRREGHQPVVVDTRSEVERWMATHPRIHAARIVAEVLEDRRRRQELRGFYLREAMRLAYGKNTEKYMMFEGGG